MKIEAINKTKECDLRILCIFEKEKLTAKLSKFAENHISHAYNSKDFLGKKNEKLSVYDESPNKRILVIGLGDKKNKETDFKNIGAKTYKNIEKLNIKSLLIEIDDKYMVDFLSGFLMASYKFDKYKEDKKETKIENIYLLSNNPKKIQKEIDEAYQNCELIRYVRDLVNMPADDMGPYELTLEAKKLSKLSKNISIKILDQQQIKKLGMNALHAVGKGSHRGTYLIVIEYKNKAKNKKPYTFIGKGISFDTGGLNMKPGRFIDHMHLDMAGAANIMGLFKKLAISNINGYFLGIIATAENAVGPEAYRPNDIVKTYSGKTVQITNTDAEGRLVLCDAITYAFKNYNPEFIIDIATLTGAALVALGHEITAVITTSEELKNKFFKSAKTTGELFWQLPLYKFHIKETKSKKADLMNATFTMPAGSIMGAAFLANFIENDTKWMHLDIAGPSWMEKPLKSYYSEGGTAVPLLTLMEFAKNL